MTTVRYKGVPDNFLPVSFSYLVDRFLNDPTSRSGGKAYSFEPKVDIIENEKAFEIQFAVPGMKKENFKIELNDGELTVSGERKNDRKGDEKYFSSFGTSYGAFSKTFALPDHIDEDRIEAKYENGILELIVPKDEKKLLKTTIKVA